MEGDVTHMEKRERFM